MLCAPIKKRDLKEVLSMIKNAGRKAWNFDLIEIWIDEIEGINQKGILEICKTSKKPLIFKFIKKIDFALINDCLNKKVKYLDIDCENDQTTIERIKTLIAEKKLILSYHNYSNTPLYTDILEIAQAVKAKGADICKIVMKAGKIEDNLVPLKLLSNANIIGIPLISFCTGDSGRMSRIYAQKFGSLIDYILPSESYRTAEGQFLLNEWLKIDMVI